MANYGYIYLAKSVSETDFAATLAYAVLDTIGAAWAVARADWSDDGPVWMVSLPGTAVEDAREASRRLLAPGDDVGFAVALQDEGKTIAFRHTPNRFERWAQGCLEEALADVTGVGVFYDATDATRPPSTREYRRSKTFRESLTRNMVKPLSPEEAAWVNQWKAIVPEGHW